MLSWCNETNSLPAMKLYHFLGSAVIVGKAYQKYLLTVIDSLWLREVTERMRHHLAEAEGGTPCAHAARLLRGAADPDTGQMLPKAFCCAAKLN